VKDHPHVKECPLWLSFLCNVKQMSVYYSQVRGHYIEDYQIGGHICYSTGGRAVQENVQSRQAVLEYSPVLPSLRSAIVYLSSDSLSSSTGFFDRVVRGDVLEDDHHGAFK